MISHKPIRAVIWFLLFLGPGGQVLAEDVFVREAEVFHELAATLASGGEFTKAGLLSGGLELEDRQLIVTDRGEEGRTESDTHTKPTSIKDLAQLGSLRDVEAGNPCSLAYGYTTLHAGYFNDAPDLTGLVPPLYLTARYMLNPGQGTELTVLFDPRKDSTSIRKIQTELRQRPVPAGHPRKTVGKSDESPAIAGGYMTYLRLFQDVAGFLKEGGDFKHAELLHSHASFRYYGPPSGLTLDPSDGRQSPPPKGSLTRPPCMPGTMQELAGRGALKHADISRPIKLTYYRRYSRSALQRVMPPGVIDQSKAEDLLFLKVTAHYLASSGETCELTVEFFQRGDEITIQRVSTRRSEREEYRVATGD